MYIYLSAVNTFPYQGLVDMFSQIFTVNMVNKLHLYLSADNVILIRIGCKVFTDLHSINKVHLYIRVSICIKYQ